MENSLKPWYKSWWGITIIIFLTFLLSLFVAVGFYFTDLVKNAKNKIDLKAISSSGNKIDGTNWQKAQGKDNYWLGSAKPKIIIVEFSDFACPYCKNSYTTIREITHSYASDVKYIFRDYPVHDNSLTLAMAARCAGEQGLFWLMHDKLFQNQGVSSNDQLNGLANQIGADLAKFKDCLTKQKYLTQVQKDYTDGESLGITGTPTWFINGYKIEGEIPHDTFIQLIDSLLK